MIELLDILIALVSSKLLSAQQATTLPLPQRRPMRSPAATVRYLPNEKAEPLSACAHPGPA